MEPMTISSILPLHKAMKFSGKILTAENAAKNQTNGRPQRKSLAQNIAPYKRFIKSIDFQ